MTNQQGALEALRCAEWLEHIAAGRDVVDIAHLAATSAAELRRLAALVEAQQPASHVQKPAEIEHVTSDVSKNGAESNMAQQPAPSAAAALPEGWVSLVITHEGQYPEEVAYGPKVLMDRLGKWLGKYFAHLLQAKSEEPAMQQLHDLLFTAQRTTGEQQAAAINKARLVLYHLRAPQPSPTPQADSQPASVMDSVADDLEDRAKRCDAPGNELYVLGLREAVSAIRAARAPADSVTAPAGGEVVGWLPVHFNGHGFYGGPLKTEAEANQYIAQVHQSSDSVTLIARPFAWVDTTPPAQAADSVLEDAALSSEQQRAIFEAYESAASESYFEVRPQIDCNDRRRVFKAGYERGWDAARKQGANHD